MLTQSRLPSPLLSIDTFSRRLIDHFPYRKVRPRMSTAFIIKGIKEQRSKIKADTIALRDKLEAEKRSMTDSEKSAFEKAQADFAALGEQLATAQASLEAFGKIVDSEEAAEPDPDPARSRRPGGIAGGVRSKGGDMPGMVDPKREKADRSAAFMAWARSQHGLPLTREQRSATKRLGLNPRSKQFDFRLNKRQAMRAMGVASGSTGGYFVPQGFADAFDLAMKATDGARDVATVIRTDTGNLIPYPTVDDTSVTGEMIGENADTNAEDATAGVVNLSAYKFSSKIILVSAELMEDSAFDIETMVGQLAGERLARAQGPKFATGTGTSQPQGIAAAAGAGVTAASATVIDPDELVRLYYSIDPAYRNSGAFGFMMHDGIRLQIALMKDGEGRPLFQASYREGEPDRIMGRPVVPNQFMQSTVATGTTTVLAGDFSKFLIRDVGMVRFRRLDERYAEKDQTGFLALMRSDSRLLNSGAVKKLVQA